MQGLTTQKQQPEPITASEPFHVCALGVLSFAQLMMATLRCSSMDRLAVVDFFEAMKKDGRLQVRGGVEGRKSPQSNNLHRKPPARPLPRTHCLRHCCTLRTT